MSARTISQVAFAFAAFYACASPKPGAQTQTTSQSQSHDTASPATDSLGPSGDYVPRDLMEAVELMASRLKPAERRWILDSASEEMYEVHLSTGMGMRNQWGLWRDSRLARYFHDLGVHHPDDMSGMILTSVWRQLHNRPIDIAGQVADIKEYWRVHSEPEVLKFSGCKSGITLKGGMPKDTIARTGWVHLGTCGSRQWWAYETGIGWYRPDAALVRAFNSP